MPRDSQGNFTNQFNWEQDAANGIGIEADRHQQGDDDQAQGLTDSLDRQGRGGMNANLAMGTNTITGLGEGSAATDAANIKQIQETPFTIGTDTGTANNYVIALSPAITAYNEGLRVRFYASNSNTGASTITVNAVTPAVPLQWAGKDLVADTVRSGVLVEADYDGNAFQIVNVPEVLPVQYGGAPDSYLNTLVNSGFEVAQFGTSVSLNNSSGYALDNWTALSGTYAATVSRVSAVNASTRYALRAQRDAGQTGTTGNLYFEHPFETEDIARLRGRRITVSFNATAGSNFSASGSQITVAVYAGTGTERARLNSAYTSETEVINSATTISTTSARYSVTSAGTVPDTTTQLTVAFFYAPTGTAGTNDWFEISAPNLQIGTAATEYVGAYYSDELERSQRLYQPLNQLGANVFEYGVFQTTDILVFGYRFHEQMRQAPTLITTGTPADYAVADFAGASASNCTSVPSISAATENGALMVFTSTGHGLSVGSTGRAQSTGSGTLAFDARL